jgi:N-carbamoyl-L-amino-acid hydrolase
MDARRDAASGAAAFVLSVRRTIADASTGSVATVGRIELEPGVFNVIPGRARVALEFRASSSDELDRLERRLLDDAAAVAADAGLDLAVDPVGRWEPTALDASVRRAIATAAAGLELNAIELLSGAGHDAQAIAAIAPAGMIFVPSARGISHQPQEYTGWDDCVNGANVLLRSALELSLRPRP